MFVIRADIGGELWYQSENGWTRNRDKASVYKTLEKAETRFDKIARQFPLLTLEIERLP
jgi:hypothetical protein